jgi:uncharacterized membrane protein
MKEMVMCKVCGYVMPKDRLRDVCPACGVKAAMFIPHDEKISEKRKRILALDIHPVLVHFPQAFSATLIALSFLAPFLHGPIASAVRSTILVLGILLPFTVAVAFVGGIIDAKVRFKRIGKKPVLKTKMILGTLFFIIALVVALLARTAPVAPILTLVLIGALSTVAISIGTVLALLGVPLLSARLPG